jgi:predicted DNA-binding transcriptional regulator YafY
LEACTRDLEEIAGIRKRPARSTLHLDIKNLRSGVLGVEAPIVFERGTQTFRYSIEGFSFFKDPLNASEQAALQHTLYLLRIFHELDTVKTLENLVVRLGGSLPGQQSVLHLDESPGVQGLHWRDALFQAILFQKAIRLNYQPFNVPGAFWIVLSPYFIKEYNNRWFVIGYAHEFEQVFTYGLDRILDILPSISQFHLIPGFNPDRHFEHVIGVSLPPEKVPERVVFRVRASQADYIRTKPLHRSQKELGELQTEDWISFELQLIPNYELESIFLSFGERVEVMEPEYIRQRMRKRLEILLSYYQ